MDLEMVLGVGLVGAIFAVLLRQYRPEYRVLLSLATVCILLIFILDGITPVMEELSSLTQLLQLSDQPTGALIKGLGICFVTQMAADACKDTGEGAIAGKIELAGKVAILLLSLPLFTQILSMAGTLFTI